jgi:hypothetical protein
MRKHTKSNTSKDLGVISGQDLTPRADARAFPQTFSEIIVDAFSAGNGSALTVPMFVCEFFLFWEFFIFDG